MSARLLLSAAAVSLAAAACAPVTPPPPMGPPPAVVFNAAAFAWSAQPGTASIEGRTDYRADGRTWRCAGSVGLTPETPWTRQRFQTLYGSTDRAALPAAVVRARTVAEASADYRGFVRNTTCGVDGTFRFEGLPQGAWFVIVPVTPQGGGEAVVLMRRVETRNGRTVQVTLS